MIGCNCNICKPSEDRVMESFNNATTISELPDGTTFKTFSPNSKRASVWAVSPDGSRWRYICRSYVDGGSFIKFGDSGAVDRLVTWQNAGDEQLKSLGIKPFDAFAEAKTLDDLPEGVGLYSFEADRGIIYAVEEGTDRWREVLDDGRIDDYIGSNNGALVVPSDARLEALGFKPTKPIFETATHARELLGVEGVQFLKFQDWSTTIFAVDELNRFRGLRSDGSLGRVSEYNAASLPATKEDLARHGVKHSFESATKVSELPDGVEFRSIVPGIGWNVYAVEVSTGKFRTVTNGGGLSKNVGTVSIPKTPASREQLASLGIEVPVLLEPRYLSSDYDGLLAGTKVYVDPTEEPDEDGEIKAFREQDVPDRNDWGYYDYVDPEFLVKEEPEEPKPDASVPEVGKTYDIVNVNGSLSSGRYTIRFVGRSLGSKVFGVNGDPFDGYCTSWYTFAEVIEEPEPEPVAPVAGKIYDITPKFPYTELKAGRYTILDVRGGFSFDVPGHDRLAVPYYDFVEVELEPPAEKSYPASVIEDVLGACGTPASERAVFFLMLDGAAARKAV